MTTTGLDTFDTTVQKSDVWLKHIMKMVGWDSRQRAYRALRGVLHTLRDRLTVDEGAHLSAQLPMLIRGIFYESWRPADLPVKYRTKEEFLYRIRKEFQNDSDVDPEEATRAVINVLKKEISSGEFDEIESMLPAEITGIWK